MVFYSFIKNFILNIKYTYILKKIYREENLIEKFSQLCNVEFRMDWVGRIYTVINPNVINDKFDVNEQIFEYTENGLSNAPYVEKYLMTRFNVIKDFVMANNLFDLLTYEIKQLDNYDNYLVIIKPITFDDCVKSIKRFIAVYGVIFILLLIFFIVQHN
jgi:hypothetical protein